MTRGARLAVLGALMLACDRQPEQAPQARPGGAAAASIPGTDALPSWNDGASK